MIFKKQANTPSSIFTVSSRVVWFSALFMGILASIPKILQLHITFIELAVDSSIAFLFTLFVWYYNLYQLPKYSGQEVTSRFFNRRLVISLLTGSGLMVLLVALHQLLFPHYQFRSMMLMYEFRGVLINLTIYMFLFLLYQSYMTRLVGVELERMKANHLEAQFELLKQQVNPHFLFNSLSTLKSMVEIGDSHAGDFILKLSDFYRFSLETRKQDIIPLNAEINILNAYVFLLKARFEEGILLEYNLDSETLASGIPPFTLQLLVENCIKHNVVSLEKPLLIRLYTADNSLIIENTLQLKKNPEVSTAMGLENINERYLLLAGKKIDIEKDDSTFKVKLPLIYGNPDH
jgi:sensor histidine kinase YesM